MEKSSQEVNRTYSFIVGEDDLRLKSEEKNNLLTILKRDIDFFKLIDAYKYTFILFFYKFNDKIILKALEQNNINEINEKNKMENLTIENKNSKSFQLANGIGFCVASFKDIFRFLKKNKKNEAGKLSHANTASLTDSIFSIEQAGSYGQALYDIIFEL